MEKSTIEFSLNGEMFVFDILNWHAVGRAIVMKKLEISTIILGQLNRLV